MRNQNVLDLVYLAMFVAIMFVMAWVPWLGFIPLGFTSVTILHIPVLIAIFFLGRKLGILTGLMFGILSWILSMVRATQLLDPLFANPVLSVLPRLLFAIITVVIYDVLNKVIKNNYVAIIITSVLGTFIHAILVLGTLVALYFPELTLVGTNGSLKAAVIFALGIFGTSSTLEALAAALIAPPIVKALRTIKSRENININLLDD